jgi:hypothetical protein
MDRSASLITVAVAAVLAVGVSVLLVLGGSKKQSASTDLPGLQDSKAPWAPEYSGLAQRIQSLRVPPPGTEKYHVHTRLAVVVDGKQQPVPPNIGLNPPARLFSAIHTHDDSGIIHIESDEPFEVKLPDVFTIWGVKFSKSQLGGHKNNDKDTVQVYVNGTKVDDPEGYVLKPHDNIVVGYGAVGSFPTTITVPFPPGL